jgi:hemerythrin-like domain-containing protein
MVLSNPTKPNTARDLLLIHKIISRALEVTQQKGQEFISTGFPEIGVRQGFHDYIQCLVAVIGGHHLTEDEIVFPEFGVRIVSAPYKLLTADHQKMVSLLDGIKTSLNNFDKEGSKQAIGAILNILQQLRDLWYPHIKIEENYFSEQNVNLVMSDEEQQAFSQQSAKFSQEHIGPDYLVIPFLLFNLTANERKVFSANMPPVVTQQLVPLVWKEKWLPMQPFLLPE